MMRAIWLLAELDSSLSEELIRAGGYDGRQIEGIAFYGTTRRPAAGQVWSF